MLVYAHAQDEKTEDPKDKEDSAIKITPGGDSSERNNIKKALEEGEDYLILDKNRKLYFYHIRFKDANILAKYLNLIGPKPKALFVYGANKISLPLVTGKTQNVTQPADTLIIEDTPENIDEIKKTLQLIDVPKSQVLIKATVTEINHSDEFHFGFNTKYDQSSITRSFFNAFQLNYNPDAYLSSQTGGTTFFQGMTFNFENVGLSLSEYGISDLSLRLLSLTGNAQIVTSPQLLIQEGEKGQIYSGESFYISQVTESTSGTYSVKTLAKQIGIKMDIYPLVIGENFVKFRFVPSISDVIGYTTSSAIDGSVPILSTREIDTLVNLPNGQYVRIGGLSVKESKVVTRGIPVISDIPLIGELFKSHDTSKSNSEIVFDILPAIINIVDNE